MSKAFDVTCDTRAAEALLDKLGAELRGSVARSTSKAMADVIYEGVLSNVRGIGKKSGNLEASIYRAFSPERLGQNEAVYRISYNKRKAPHGHLLEYGFIQRYASYVKDGRWHTAVQPSARGKPRPGRRASQAAKDAYYVLREGGPVQVPAKAFMRRAFHRANEAIAAGKVRFSQRLQEIINEGNLK